MHRIGIVTAYDSTFYKVRVQLPDLGIVTGWLPVVVSRAANNKEYNLPDIGEEVLCAFLSDTGVEDGVVLGCLYNKHDRPPTDDEDMWMTTFKDGAKISYNRRTHALSATIPGTATITANKVTIVGDLEVSGNIHASGKIEDENGNTNHHEH